MGQPCSQEGERVFIQRGASGNVEMWNCWEIASIKILFPKEEMGMMAKTAQ